MQSKTAASLSEKIGSLYRETCAILIENPTLGLLFLIIGMLDFCALFSLFLAHSWPFSVVLAPIIRTFWDDRFLHYPQNLLLLPKLVNHAHFVILSLFGVLVSGIVIKKVEGAERGVKVTTFAAAGPVFKKYFSLLAAWLISYGLFIFLAEKILELLPGALPLQFAAGFGISLTLQVLFAFILPALLIAGQGFFRDFGGALFFGLRHFGVAALIVVLPVLLMVSYSFLKALAPVYARSYPEAILWILGLGIFVSLIVDLTVTVATTLFYVKARNRQW